MNFRYKTDGKQQVFVCYWTELVRMGRGAIFGVPFLLPLLNLLWRGPFGADFWGASGGEGTIEIVSLPNLADSLSSN